MISKYGKQKHVNSNLAIYFTFEYLKYMCTLGQKERKGQCLDMFTFKLKQIQIDDFAVN